MTRLYIQPSWTDAASDHSEWSGGNGQYRGDKSQDISTFVNGKANVKAFSDDAIERNKAKTKPKSITNSILLAERNMNRLEDMSQALEQEYMSQAIDTETYVYARKTLDKRLEKAFIRLAKDRNWSHNTDTEEESLNTPQNRVEKVVLHRVFDGLSEGNVFLGPIVAVSKMIVKLKLIYGVIKS